jgi:hypothetical protein
VTLQALHPIDGESVCRSVGFDLVHRGQAAAGKDLGEDELDEPAQLEDQGETPAGRFARVQGGDDVQQHDSLVGQRSLRESEEVGVALEAEMLEGADGYDPIDGLVELSPILQPRTTGA